MKSFLVLQFLIIIRFSALPIHSQVILDSTLLDTTIMASGLDTPWEILWGPDDHIWITERGGRVSRLDPETGELTELLTISGVHEQGESGLLGLGLHPNFPTEPHIFVVYNYLEDSRIRERLVRYTYSNGTISDPNTLLEGISGASTHNGSRIVIDANQKLYMTTGDASNPSLPQQLGSLNGKILRMNLDGTVPEDNPFPGSLVWSLGHRNPQGLVISPGGMIYSSEHGPSSDDEVNIIRKGRNYGWPDVRGFCEGATEEAFCADSNVVEPIAAWTPTLAVAGTDYYSGPAIPEWQNSLLVTSLKAGTLVSLKLSEDGMSVVSEEQHFAGWFGRLRDLCVAPDGRVFIAVSNRDGRGTLRQGDDRIVRITPRISTAFCFSEKEVTLCPGASYDFNGRAIQEPGTYTDTIPSELCDTIVTLTVAYHPPVDPDLPDTLRLSTEERVTLYTSQNFISYSWNGEDPSNNYWIPISGSQLGKGTFTIFLEAADFYGCIQYDTTVVIVEETVGIPDSEEKRIRIYPNPVTGNEATLEYETGRGSTLIIYDATGKVVKRTEIPPYQERTNIRLPENPGLYYLRINGLDGMAGAVVLKQ